LYGSGGELDGDSIGRQLIAWEWEAEPLPRELELELTTATPLPDAVLRPCGSALGRVDVAVEVVG